MSISESVYSLLAGLPFKRYSNIWRQHTETGSHIWFLFRAVKSCEVFASLTVYVHVFLPTETLICQVLQPSHFSSQGQKVRDPPFQAEESAEHKDVVVTALLPEGLYRAALTRSCSFITVHCLTIGRLSGTCFGLQRCVIVLFVHCRDEGRSARLTSLSPLSSF